MATAKIKIPPKLIPVFNSKSRYKGSYGGRGSGKTMTFALMTAVTAYIAAENGREGVILCAREYMNSLEDSSMQEIKSAIKSVPWLDDYFDMGEKYIRTKCGRVKYIFTGLRHNLDSIKSKAKILVCWIDEAEGVSERAYSKLLPTVREEGSEVWITWNPELDGSPTDTRFRKHAPDNAMIVEMNYSDNPWFPDVLEQERLNDYHRLDINTYAWIWEGAYLENSDSQILSGKVKQEEFEPRWDWEPMYGLDWGFAQDPTAAVCCYLRGNTLYIRHEAGGVGMELDDTAQIIKDAIPDIQRYTIRADSARPESISYCKRHGLPMITGVDKWKGSVEDGIAWLRSLDSIVIHPDCPEILRESRLYQYKVHKQTGDILPEPMDKWNHYIDALRYACAPIIQNQNCNYEELL